MATDIQWLAEGVEMPCLDFGIMTRWIDEVLAVHGKIRGPLTYIFCNDDEILNVNLRYLHHDYYTDIITFDYTHGRRVSGDMFISLDTVRTNAEQVGATYTQELNRVIIHGVLHLCGINDKGPGERKIMEANENEALQILQRL